MNDHVVYSSKLSRPIRVGDAEELGIATEVLARQALADGDTVAAANWASYLSEEPRRVLFACGTWLAAVLSFTKEHVPDFENEVVRLTGIIGDVPPAPPDVDPESVGAPEEKRLVDAANSGDSDAFEEALSDLKRVQWKVHDDQGDWLWGLMSVCYDHLGEDQMETVYRETLNSWVPARYATLAELTQHEKFELTIDLMRGHFCGPSDNSHVDVDETEDSWILSFDPCGSGGRMRRGDPARGQEPRTESPYGFRASKNAHGWTWGEEGVCLYCAHCSFVNEILPIERMGVPLRVTAYPRSPHDKCRWTIYKDAAAIPAEVYERVGKRKPTADQA